MTQTQEDMRNKIRQSSNRKILRRQLELLAEYSRTDYQYLCPIPESSNAMVAIHKELVKAQRILFMRVLIAFFGFMYLINRFSIKRIQFIK